MERIVNPFKGIPVGWDWAEHKANGKIGGTDYKTYVGQSITSATRGTAYRMSNTWVAIRRADGVRVNYRELRTTSGTFPRTVNVGDKIGTAGATGAGGIKLWAHIDAQNVFGIRIPFEPLVKKYDKYVATQRAKAVKKARQAEVRKIGRHLNAQKLGKKTAASVNGNPGPVYWWLVQAWGAREELFDRKVTGTPGPLTMKLERTLAKQIKA